jgi:hypothetical protein
LLFLIQFFVELCLLRRAPQDLPASSALLGLTLAADLVAGALLGSLAGLTPAAAMAEGLLDVLFTLALLYFALQALGRSARFVQTATALLGAGAVIGTVAIVPLSLAPLGGAGNGDLAALVGLLFLVLIAWSILVTGHILRHCFDLRLGQGVVIAVAYNLLSYSLIGGLFSGS